VSGTDLLRPTHMDFVLLVQVLQQFINDLIRRLLIRGILRIHTHRLST
jgi:hypothetical protein